ncbi:hypothetical protein [Fodinicola acaciae]|uniref:hypothetical protein n=1 Tax=Fodinicola acaciae TaxID=2681555 RepID=UPI0013D7C78B|nr:hypothetical protein [Fodinicola acaciae]
MNQPPPPSALRPPWRDEPPSSRGTMVLAGFAGGLALFLLLALPIGTGFLFVRTNPPGGVVVAVLTLEILLYCVALIAAIVGAAVPRVPRVWKSACYGTLIAFALHLLLLALTIIGLVVACFALLSGGNR